MIRVFVYDDNNARKESLMALIELTDNMEFVGSAPNCANVEKDMEATNPHVVLMDIEMPIIDGIDGVRMIKSKYPSIKVIMQTVYEDSDKIFKALQNGAEGYILKKASINNIIDSINMVHSGGAFMTPSVALQVMSYFKKSTIQDEKLSSLTSRELEVLNQLSEGDSYKMVAEKLSISYSTVNNHIKNIYQKLQVHSMGEAIAYALNKKIS
jgi:DNA-binding NarL/FixJ family response regulator